MNENKKSNVSSERDKKWEEQNEKKHSFSVKENRVKRRRRKSYDVVISFFFGKKHKTKIFLFFLPLALSLYYISFNKEKKTIKTKHNVQKEERKQKLRWN